MNSRRVFAFFLLAIAFDSSILRANAQGLRERIRQRIQNSRQQQHGIQPLKVSEPVETPPPSRQKKSFSQFQQAEKQTLAGLNCAIWRPKASGKKVPLVIFSHGMHGINTQSQFLMQALADNGYLVIAPNHKDALGIAQIASRSTERLSDPSKWNDKLYADRKDDIKKLIVFLHATKTWDSQIDWNKVAFAGHSLGGYTAMGLAGAWPSWKQENVKAILALSPFCKPFLQYGTINTMKTPIMYQSGTRDLGIYPSLNRPGAAFDQSSSPAYLVVFDKAGHFSFSNLNPDKQQEELISRYSIQFLDKYLKDLPRPNLTKAQPGVKDLRYK